MNDDRSLERAARSWIEEGPTQAPDHAVDAALAQIVTTRQERDLWVPWRLPPMNSISRLVAGIAAVAVVVAVGLTFSTTSPAPGPGSVPSPSPTAAPTAAPSAAAGTPAPSPNDTACHLLTDAEIAASAGIGLSPVDASGRARETTTATSECWYTTGGGIGDVVAAVGLTKPGGTAAFAAAKAIAGVQTVPNLGAQAVFDPAWGRLYVLKGDTLVTILSGNFQTTRDTQLAQVSGLARLIIPRV